MADIKELQKIATQVRRDVIRMTHGAKCGHPGGSLGCADYFTALYFEVMKHDPAFNMNGENEDIFFLSNGHICPGWYSVLARSGYFDLAELATFRKLDSRLQGHPATAEDLPGIRIASGSLGQGLSVAVGAAITKKLNGDAHLVYSLHGDGELQEGQNWEAAMFAVKHKVDNIISTVDYNGQQIDGPVDDIIPLGDLKAKWDAFGWHTFELDGHDMNAILETLDEAENSTGKGRPIMILMSTSMGKGVDFMTDNYKWHGVAPNDEQKDEALSQLEETLGDY
ncbi:transketolase [Cytophagaceae bacterium AH-315-L13]|nr:transketolase [Cytophagaceae bacterium AH-315-L13]